VIQLHRLIRILWVFSKYRLDEFLRLLSLPLGIRIILATAPWRLFPARHEARGASAPGHGRAGPRLREVRPDPLHPP